MKTWNSALAYRSIFLLALCPHHSNADQAPAGNGQLENPPKIIAGGTDEQGRDYSYLGQVAGNGKLILTASNGFFTKGTCQAKGESRLPKVGDEKLIVPNYEYLDWKSTEGSLRWHILVKNAGALQLNLHLESAGDGPDIEASFGDSTKKISNARSSREKPRELSFEVKEPGEYQLSLSAVKPENGPGVGRLFRIEAFGTAIEGAQLLRVRWRPAAVHGGYDTSKVPDSKLLVFTTRSTAPISSYSPITTPFGYYGTVFDGDRRSNGAFNFSMWGKENAASNLKMMPHLLGIGSPDGEFSGFGHEGSGVKPRGWDPMPDRPELVVQALRLVPGKEYDSYYGYYFDHPTKAWKFYGGGNKWHGGKSNQHLRLGSFCEVPGPPQVERTGDIYREVRRRGWSHDNGNWIPLEQYKPGGSGSSGDEPVNKSWFTTEDGEYAMGCGGIRLYQHKDSLIKPGNSDGIPYFLSSPSIGNLFSMPIAYGEIQAREVASDRATIELDVLSGEPFSDGVIYFGEKDALTFAPRDLHGTEKNSALSQSINSMSWQNSAKITSPKLGVNAAELTDLKPETRYFYRVLLTNSVSRIWNSETRTFTTPKTGDRPIELSSLIPAKASSRPLRVPTTPRKIEGESFRVWTYSLDGKAQTLEGRLTGIAGQKIQIERKSDGKKGTLDLRLFSAADQNYVSSL